MKQEFVHYELAFKLIYELGFKENCLATIDEIGYLHIKGTKSSPHGAILYDIVDCPTFSQAFRWFRNQGFFVSFSTHNYNIHDFYIKWSMPESTTLSESILSDAYNTYQETELACLEKLIEILERKGAYVTRDRKK
jgi:hypothetical protein